MMIDRESERGLKVATNVSGGKSGRRPGSAFP